MRILDVGTGTGIIAERMRTATGPNTLIVGVDAALTMLQEGRRTFQYPVVVAQMPQLPFAAATFDVAVAGFVLSHVADYGLALTDIVRVCRRGARVGMTVWGALPNPAAQLWTEVASRFVDRDELERGFRAHIPWDAWFANTSRLQSALTAAGLQHAVVHTRTYAMRMATSDFLASRNASIQGTVLRERLSDERWDRFRLELIDTFESRFGAHVEFERDVHFGIAEK